MLHIGLPFVRQCDPICKNPLPVAFYVHCGKELLHNGLPLADKRTSRMFQPHAQHFILLYVAEHQKDWDHVSSRFVRAQYPNAEVDTDYTGYLAGNMPPARPYGP